MWKRTLQQLKNIICIICFDKKCKFCLSKLNKVSGCINLMSCKKCNVEYDYDLRSAFGAEDELLWYQITKNGALITTHLRLNSTTFDLVPNEIRWHDTHSYFNTSSITKKVKYNVSPDNFDDIVLKMTGGLTPEQYRKKITKFNILR